MLLYLEPVIRPSSWKYPELLHLTSPRRRLSINCNTSLPHHFADKGTSLITSIGRPIYFTRLHSPTERRSNSQWLLSMFSNQQRQHLLSRTTSLRPTQSSVMRASSGAMDGHRTTRRLAKSGKKVSIIPVLSQTTHACRRGRHMATRVTHQAFPRQTMWLLITAPARDAGTSHVS